MSAIDFDLRNITGIAFDMDGVLSPSTVPMDNQGRPARMVNVKDGYALQYAAKKGIPIAIITGALSESIELRFKSLGINHIYQGAAHKLPFLKEWIESISADPYNIAYMGDDIPDIPCMQYVGLPCCPFDAAPEVMDKALFISKSRGGYGCARDLIREIMINKNLWANNASAFNW